ncbi:sigma-70 family RNA polymerase sigma factor [Patescibacteria group bacterium]|nr:sigma-70 family RNA polymerase sigma factor [Patescibacteria group bacterium]
MKEKERNPVSEYIEKISKIPVLSKKEERKLTKKIAKGDQNAKKKLVESNLRLAFSIASRYTRNWRNEVLDILDLIQEGNTGLFRAVEKFDWRKGYKFSVYASWWIKAAILKLLCDQARTIRMQVHVLLAVNRYTKEVNEILAKEHRTPTNQEIAEKIGLSAQTLFKYLKLFRDADAISIDSPLGTVNDRWDTNTLNDVIPDKETPNPEEFFQMRQLNEKTREMLLFLTPREEKVLRMRYGVGEKGVYSLQEVGNMFKVTREMIRQIEIKALKKLRTKFIVRDFSKQSFALSDYL